MEHRHLWLRTPRQSAILRVRAAIMRAAAEYFDINGFIRTDPPILTPNACEGTSDLFEMKYFDEDMAYLTQSGQLYVEATALALGKVYSFGPTFRAEKSKTRRHLTEFWMIEPEEAYLDLDGLMTLAENFLTHIVTRVLESHRADLTVIGRDITKLEAITTPGEFPSSPTTKPTPCSTHAYKDGKLENPHIYGDDFGSPDETYICSQFDKPVMVHRYPADIKAFYMEPDPETPPRPSASTSSPPKATAKSSAARNASTTTTSSNPASSPTTSRSPPSSGTSTSASTAASPTAASAWASSAASPGSAASSTSAKPSPLRVPSTASIRRPPGRLIVSRSSGPDA